MIFETDLQSMNALEGSARGKMLHEEPKPVDDALIPSGDVVSVQKAMREMRARYEVSTTNSYLTQSYLTMPSGDRLTSNNYGSA